MIVAEQKPIEEILSSLPEVDSLLVVGCDTCVTVCMAGGEKEVKLLCSAIQMSDKKIKKVEGISIERQCDREFLEEIATQVGNNDLVLSMACGAGVQMMSDYFQGKIILPALNTLSMGGVQGLWPSSERCGECGDCVLDTTGGICPITTCAKSLLNGACGGSYEGKCEIHPDRDCGWFLIYERLKKLGRLDDLLKTQPLRNFENMEFPMERRHTIYWALEEEEKPQDQREE